MNPTRHSSTSLTALQKAAVLINSLDVRSADALLEQMPPDQAAKIRDELLQVDDLPADLQEAVIAEFLNSGGRLPAIPEPKPSAAVELELSSEADSLALHSSHELAGSRAPFDFLRDASPALLAEFLRQEHPQTAAVVLAHLDPEQAARVLERLPAELSMESLARMARLHQVSPEVLLDLESEIRAQLLPQIDAERRPQGLAGASAVLSALNDPLRKRMLGQLAHRDQALVRQLGYLDAGTQRPSSSTQFNPVSQTQAAKLAPPTTTIPAKKNSPPTIRFAQFVDLNDATLKRIFAEADPQVLLLALTGADEPLVARILKQLPAADAVAVRKRLNNPGALRLRDVDAAQQELAQLAAELHELGVVRIPLLAHNESLSLQS